MAAVGHGHPPAIQVFCEGLSDHLIDFYRNHPIVLVITAVALTAIGLAVFLALPALFPASAAIAVIGEIGATVVMVVGWIGTTVTTFFVDQPFLGLVTIVAFTALMIAACSALPVVLPGATTVIIADALTGGLLISGFTASFAFLYETCDNLCN